MTVIINGDTGVSGVDGSASTPALQGTDSNTGIVFPAADTVTVATGGAERMRIDSSGRVLVGITANLGGEILSAAGSSAVGYGISSNRLNVLGTGDNAGFIRFRGGNASSSTASVEYAGVYALANSVTASSESGTLLFNTTSAGASAERMRIDSSGNVGIGVTSPQVRLSLQGVGLTTGTANILRLFDDGGAITSTSSNSYGLGHNNSTGQFSYTAGTGGFHAFFTANAERMRIDSSGNLLFNSGYGSAAVAYGCRAWVNFNGTTASPSTIRGSGNVSSVTKNGTGDYTVNFTTAMPDANYAATGLSGPYPGISSTMGIVFQTDSSAPSTTAARFTTRQMDTATNRDPAFVCVSIFR